MDSLKDGEPGAGRVKKGNRKLQFSQKIVFNSVNWYQQLVAGKKRLIDIFKEQFAKKVGLVT
jgi:hypothetical protein